jgi:hypothetical protein
MPLESEEENNSDGTVSFYVFDSDDPSKRHQAFLIDDSKEKIIFYPKPEEEFVFKEVELNGFKKIPPEISELGYFKAGLSYFFTKKFKGKKVKSFKINKGVKSSLRTYSGHLSFTLGYDALVKLKSRLTELSNENKRERSLAVDEFFHSEFPSKFDPASLPGRQRAARAIRNLDPSIIEHLDANDVEVVLDFMESMLSGKYSSAARRRKLFGAAKMKVDEYNGPRKMDHSLS